MNLLPPFRYYFTGKTGFVQENKKDNTELQSIDDLGTPNPNLLPQGAREPRGKLKSYIDCNLV